MERTSTSSESEKIGLYFLVGERELIALFRNRVAFKSPATISQEQATAKYDGTSGVLATRGRHDPCVVPR